MKILFLETRELSYSSSTVFMEELKEAFFNLGDTVYHFIVTDIEKSEDVLEKLLKIAYQKKFDFIFDVNSILPLLYEDNKPYLDCFEIPFVDYIVDHPIHQAHVLDRKLNNFNVICLDESHCKYIRKYYPDIKQTIAMPLAATSSERGDSYVKQEINYKQEFISMRDRKIDILFPATYTPLSYFEDILKERGIVYLNCAKQCIEIIKDGKTFDIEDIRNMLSSECKNASLPLSDVSRYVDKYIREYLRQRAVEAVLAAGLSLDVIGARWEMYEGKFINRLHIHEPKKYIDILDYMRLSKTVLNVQPLFKTAPHDRIYNAMANGAVAITDFAQMLSGTYEQGADYIKYDFENCENDFERIRSEYFDNNGNEKLESICQNAYKKVIKNDIWEDRCNTIKKFVKKIQLP